MRPPQDEAGATPLPHQPIDGHGDALPGSRPGASGLPETDYTRYDDLLIRLLRSRNEGPQRPL